MNNQTVVVLDFGGQYNQLIARRVRECGVYCELLPYNTPVEKLKEKNLVGIVLTGGPNSSFSHICTAAALRAARENTGNANSWSARAELSLRESRKSRLAG